MGMPQSYVQDSLDVDEEANQIVITCAKCNQYGPKHVDGDDYDTAKDAFGQAKRQLGSHYSAKHNEGNEEGQGGTTPDNTPSQSQQQPSPSQGGGQPTEPSQQTQGKNSADSPQGQGSDYGGGVNERELIYRKGKEGLLELKAERLKDWLQEANGVGGQTESRILKVFQRNESVNSNPYALYNLLEDETTASGSYINTIVDDVFEPEREHADVLESTGYTPWYNRSNGPGQFGNQGQAMGGPSMGGPGGQQYGQSASMGMGQQGGPQRGQQQQQNQQQPNQGREDLSKEEVAQMITHGINSAKEQSEENPIRDGLSDATDEALREMASNVGGLAGTANRVFEEALMSYAQENPEFIIENMDFLQKALGAANGPKEQGGNQQPQQPESERRVDQAIEQIGSQSQQQSPMQNQQPQQQQAPSQMRDGGVPQQQPQQHQPSQNVEHNVGPSDSGFEPDTSTPSSDPQPEPANTEPEPEPSDEAPPEPMPTPGDEESKKSEQRRQQFEEKAEQSNDAEQKKTEEDEAFDELFGDMAE